MSPPTRIITTRREPGDLDRGLARAGFDVVNIAMIRSVGPRDGGRELRRLMTDDFDWIVATSPKGADALGADVRQVASRLAAVGSATARRLAQHAGRPVDVVPDQQTARHLAAALPPRPGRVLLAQADRADDTLERLLVDRGADVVPVVAYRTVLRAPTDRERQAARSASCVTFASGSAVEGWVAAFGVGSDLPAVAIGPSTAQVGAELGLQIDHVATDHSVDGLVAATIAALGRSSRSSPTTHHP